MRYPSPTLGIVSCDRLWWKNSLFCGFLRTFPRPPFNTDSKSEVGHSPLPSVGQPPRPCLASRGALCSARSLRSTGVRGVLRPAAPLRRQRRRARLRQRLARRQRRARSQRSGCSSSSTLTFSAVVSPPSSQPSLTAASPPSPSVPAPACQPCAGNPGEYSAPATSDRPRGRSAP